MIDFHFDMSLAEGYKSNSQKTRVMSESWVGRNLYCPICGNPHICNLENNMPVADLKCNNCGEVFELKSKRGAFGKKIADGAYTTMIERINSASNPNLFVMNYSSDYQVTDLILIPKFFFVENIIVKRKPLAPMARRAGWIGCNILYEDIPKQGRIKIIEDQYLHNSSEIVETYAQIKKLQTNNIESRGWLMDVLNCINSISNTEFSLQDVYKFSDVLQEKHTGNHNVEAKIRQQLQVLRDKGFVEFTTRRHYRKLL